MKATRNILSRAGLALGLALAVAGACVPNVRAQQPADETTRQLWDTNFLQKRQKPKAAPKKPARKPTYRRISRAPVAKKTGPKTAPVASPVDAAEIVGVTIWRLRPSAASDDTAARLLVQEEASQDGDAWTPERVDADTPLREGQRVRLSIEAPNAGYLYVIDREQYADGSYGDPYLIFPTERTRGGDNKVSAGSVVEIPAQEDRPFYFTLKKSKPSHVGEAITVLVTSEPLEGVKIGRDPLELPENQVAEWEAKWGGPVERIEMAGGAGKAYTKAEKAAGASAGEQLTQDDPLPQTIYRVDAKDGAPVLVTIPLRIGK